MEAQIRRKVRRALGVVVFFAIVVGIAASQMQKGRAAPEGDAAFHRAFMAEQQTARAAVDAPAAQMPAGFTDLFRRVLATVMSFSAGDPASVTDGRIFFTEHGWDEFTTSLHQARYVNPHDEPYANISFEVTQGPATYSTHIDDKYKNMLHVAVLATQKVQDEKGKSQKVRQFCTFVLETPGTGKALPERILIENVICAAAD
ncbi:MAG: hypothetical protein PW788_13290 [Micavibrio sp.]|nr:hypothetical protein [Micavibrio sp.]